jgi:phage internal scaffolding protein
MSFNNPHFERRAVKLNTGKGLTEQSHKRSCDMHHIMRQENRHNVQRFLEENDPTYGNVIGVPEYHEAMNQIAKANELYEQVPAHIRKQFENGAQFAEFMSNEDNREAISSLGLTTNHLPPLPDKRPARDKVANPAGDGETLLDTSGEVSE